MIQQSGNPTYLMSWQHCNLVESITKHLLVTSHMSSYTGHELFLDWQHKIFIVLWFSHYENIFCLFDDSAN